MDLINAAIASIRPLDEAVMSETQQYLDRLTKPVGSLAVLERMACQIAGVQGLSKPAVPEKALVLMAADHGVAEEGISAFPAEVTGQMVYNFVSGGAGINVLARHAGAKLVLVDVGVKADLAESLPIHHCKIRRGTANIRRGPAMERREVLQALKIGIQVANELVDKGVRVIGLGEMGIGNTTASSAIVHVFTGESLSLVVGRGTGITDEFFHHKIRVIEEAVALNRPDAKDAIDVMAKVGGLEIAAMAGVVGVSRWTGLRLTEEIADLMKTLRDNGIDVFICTASLEDVVAVFATYPKYGYNVAPENMIGMRLEKVNDIYQDTYKKDWPQVAEPGKTVAIKRVVADKRGYGPILVAGDSNGDWNMMTEFPDVKRILIVNRLKGGKKIGALSAEAAATIGKPNARVLLQGRNENTGLWMPTEYMLKLGKDVPALLAN